MRTSRWFDAVFLTVLGVVVWQVAVHRVQISDWWALRGYTPAAEITKLADDAGLSDTGKRLFLRSHPQLVDRTTLDSVCSVENLGCITADGHIYILSTAEPSQYQNAIVTVAHETLHVAWRRLGRAERDAINDLLTEQSRQISDHDVVQDLKEYSEEDPEGLADERHSIFGSELSELTPKLEEHYKLYFADRTKAVSAYNLSK